MTTIEEEDVKSLLIISTSSIPACRLTTVATLEKSLKTKTPSSDVDHVIRLCCAIITHNAEILLKINKNRSALSHKSVVYEKGCAKSNYSENGNPIFERKTYSTVDLKSTNTKGSTMKKIEFLTSPKVESLTFAPIPRIPPLLRQLVAEEEVRCQVDGFRSDLPDYLFYIESAYSLNDEILVMFMRCLKEHLEDVQLWLGKVETWLVEPADSKGYIEQTFGTVFDESSSVSKVKGKVPNVCALCSRPFANHYTSNRFCNVKEGGFRFYRCVNEEHVLLSVTTAEQAHGGSFDVNGEAGVKKLNAFLEYMNL